MTSSCACTFGAVIQFIVCAVIPYLKTPWRWALLVVPLIVSFGRIYVGAHLPLDLVDASYWAWHELRQPSDSGVTL